MPGTKPESLLEGGHELHLTAWGANIVKSKSNQIYLDNTPCNRTKKIVRERLTGVLRPFVHKVLRPCINHYGIHFFFEISNGTLCFWIPSIM